MLARVALAGGFALDGGRVVERQVAFYICPGIGHDDAGLADARQLCELASETVVIAENGRLRGAACAHWQMVAKNAFAPPLCKVCRPALVQLQKKIATSNEMHEQVTHSDVLWLPSISSFIRRAIPRTSTSRATNCKSDCVRP